MSIFNLAEQEIVNGNIEEAKIMLRKYSKKNSLSTQERVRRSTLEHWSGDSSSSQKTLKNFISTDFELENSSNDQLIEFIRETHMLNFVGAYETAIERYKKVLEYSSKNKIELNKVYPQFYNSLGNHYLQTFQFKKGLDIFSSSESYFEISSSQYFFNVLSQVDCLVGLKKFNEALRAIRKLEDVKVNVGSLNAIYKQVLGEIYLKKGDLTKARTFLIEAKYIFEKRNEKNKDYAYCLKYLGVYYGLMKDFSKSEILLNLSEEILVSSSNSPLPLVEISHYRLVFNIESASDQLRKFFFPVFFPENYFIVQLKAEDNCLLINKEKVEKINYIHTKIVNKTIDLHSGFALVKDHIIYRFSEIEIKFLTSLIGAGDIGVHELVLDENIYGRDDGLCLNVERVKKVASRLKRVGFEITIKNKCYRLNNRTSYDFIISREIPSCRELAYFKKFNKEINRQNIQEVLQVSRSKALSLLRKWEALKEL